MSYYTIEIKVARDEYAHKEVWGQISGPEDMEKFNGFPSVFGATMTRKGKKSTMKKICRPARRELKREKKMPKKGTITAAEYKALRELCGLTQEDARQLHGCQNKRTIQRWEDGSNWVSERAEARITWLNQIIGGIVANAVAQYRAAIRSTGSKPEQIVLIKYSERDYKKFAPDMVELRIPHNAHNAAVARTYLALRDLGANISIVQMDVQDYMTYLGAHGLQDDQASRAMWASNRYEREITS